MYNHVIYQFTFYIFEPMEFSAEQIAGILKGEIQGNPNVVVNDLSKIEEGKTGTLKEVLSRFKLIVRC